MASPPPAKKCRKANFSDNELSALVDGYEQRKGAIEGRGNSAHGSIAKQRAWEQITRDLFAVSGIRREVADVKKKWADVKSINKKRGAAVKKSQCATGGGVGDEPLNEMEERIVGSLNVESVEGIPGAFDIGVAPIHEVVVGVPFSLPLSGTPARPSSAGPVPSPGTPARLSSARPVPSLDSQEASTSGQPEVGDMSAHSSGNPKSRQERIKEDPTQKIIEGQQAITARLDRLVELHEQMVALKAYKLNVCFQNGKIVPKYD